SIRSSPNKAAPITSGPRPPCLTVALVWSTDSSCSVMCLPSSSAPCSHGSRPSSSRRYRRLGAPPGPACDDDGDWESRRLLSRWSARAVLEGSGTVASRGDEQRHQRALLVTIEDGSRGEDCGAYTLMGVEMRMRPAPIAEQQKR